VLARIPMKGIRFLFKEKEKINCRKNKGWFFAVCVLGRLESELSIKEKEVFVMYPALYSIIGSTPLIVGNLILRDIGYH
jgi:hypothetical protein